MNATTKHTLAAVACALALATVPGAAVAWNAGTHAYIAGELQKKAGRTADAQQLRNRLYGSTGPDFFNYAFGEPFFTIADYLHEYHEADVTLRVWDAARASGDAGLVAFAYGFVSHDNAFGADASAHVEAMTGGARQGYAVAKSGPLARKLAEALAAQGVTLPAPQVALAAHVLVEAAVDLLVQAQLDPQLGARLHDAVANADEGIGHLLAAAYREPLARYFSAGDAEAAATIVYVESKFRETELLYAGALAASTPDDFAPFAAFNAELASSLFGLPAQALLPLASAGIEEAMALVRDDFQREIFATIGWVNGSLASRGISP